MATSSDAVAADKAVACLNHMVADALSLAPSCLRYMAALRDPAVFRFCAVPQLMALATLEKVVNNPDVFTGVVKIRKGRALLLMSTAGDNGMAGVYTAFLTHSRAVLAAIPRHHKDAHATAAAAARAVERICLDGLGPSAAGAARALASPVTLLAVAVAAAALLRYVYSRSESGAWGEGRVMPRITDSLDVLSVTALVAAVVFLVAFAGVPLVMAITAPAPPARGQRAGGGGGAAGAGEGEGDGAAGADGAADAVKKPARARGRKAA